MSIKRSGIAIAALMSGVVVLTSGLQLSERWRAYQNAIAAHALETRLAAGFDAVGSPSDHRQVGRRRPLRGHDHFEDVLHAAEPHLGTGLITGPDVRRPAVRRPGEGSARPVRRQRSTDILVSAEVTAR